MPIEEPTILSSDPIKTAGAQPSAERPDAQQGALFFPRSAVVQLVSDDPQRADAMVSDLHPADVTVTANAVLATDGDISWSWLASDIKSIVHGADEPWTIFVDPEVSEFGVSIPVGLVDTFRAAVARFAGVEVRHQLPRDGSDRGDRAIAPAEGPTAMLPPPTLGLIPFQIAEATPAPDLITEPVTVTETIFGSYLEGQVTAATPVTTAVTTTSTVAPSEDATRRRRGRDRQAAESLPPPTALAGIDAREISAWFGTHQVLDRVSLDMAAGQVTALIGPSGCGKSTFLRILNRMHEMIPAASMAGEVLLDGHDIYDANRKLTDARREIGMVFQKPNPFPAMSIYDNVLASFRLTGLKASTELKDETVESCLTKAGLWNEVRDRLRQPGGGLSGGQQQRLCIARALAIKPRVLLMDEPCSALDPTSTRRIEETILQLVSEVTIVIVTHNMQQAVRVSNQCAFFLAEQGTPGVIVEHGPTSAMFGSPLDPRTNDYVNGRFG